MLARPAQRPTGKAALAALAQQGHRDASAAATSKLRTAATEEAQRILEDSCHVRPPLMHGFDLRS